MNYNISREFQEVIEYEQRERERIAINALIEAKQSRLHKVRKQSKEQLEDVADAMFQNTNVILPEALTGALKGESAEAAKNYLKSRVRPNLNTPVKRGVYDE